MAERIMHNEVTLIVALGLAGAGLAEGTSGRGSSCSRPRLGTGDVHASNKPYTLERDQ